MKFTKNIDRYNRVSKIEYAHAANVAVSNYPGDFIQCVGTFTELEFSEANITETDEENGLPIILEIEIIVRGQNKENDKLIKALCSQYTLLRVTYINGDVKLFGTPETPIVFTSTTGGNVIETTLSATRQGAEKGKYIV